MMLGAVVEVIADFLSTIVAQWPITGLATRANHVIAQVCADISAFSAVWAELSADMPNGFPGFVV